MSHEGISDENVFVFVNIEIDVEKMTQIQGEYRKWTNE